MCLTFYVLALAIHCQRQLRFFVAIFLAAHCTSFKSYGSREDLLPLHLQLLTAMILMMPWVLQHGS
jgi:hypothetical protein